MVVQYWNSHEKLYAYASVPEAKHRPAWTAFNRRARKAPGSVGIWHETYLVDRAETIYAAHAAQRAGEGDRRDTGGAPRRAGQGAIGERQGRLVHLVLTPILLR